MGVSVGTSAVKPCQAENPYVGCSAITGTHMCIYMYIYVYVHVYINMYIDIHINI